MGVCIFVASGLNFDVDRYLPTSPFKAAGIFRKGQIPPKSNPGKLPREDSGFSVIVSESPDLELAQQLEDALMFLVNHEQDLVNLKKAGMDNMLLDFGVEFKTAQRSDYLPPELMVALARFSMGLVFSTIRVPEG